MISNIYTNILNLLLLVFIVVPAWRPIFKYAPSFQTVLIALYGFALVGLIYIFQHNKLSLRLKGLIANPAYLVLILVIASITIRFAYPIADGLKIQMRGSDQDDCVIIGVNNLLSLSHPYTQQSYLGNPCSPGMGMLLLYAPFVFLNSYQFGAIIFAGFAIFVVRKYTMSDYHAAIFATLLFGSLFQMEMLVVGTDLFLLGCGVVIVTYQLIEASAKKDKLAVIWLAVLTGLLASTRINFLVLAPIISLFIFFHWRRAAIIFAAVSMSTSILPSAYIYFLSPADFSPFHLIVKSKGLLTEGMKEFVIALSFLSFLLGAELVRRSIASIPLAVFLSISPMLLALSMGDLVFQKGWSFAEWEGANYLLPVIPLAIAILTIQIKN